MLAGCTGGSRLVDEAPRLRRPPQTHARLRADEAGPTLHLRYGRGGDPGSGADLDWPDALLRPDTAGLDTGSDATPDATPDADGDAPPDLLLHDLGDAQPDAFHCINAGDCAILTPPACSIRWEWS